jgi:methionine synthase I (cobalamin-dependent)
VCDREGRILSGESVAVAAEALLPLGVKALGVNCGPAHTLAKPLAELRAICGPDFPLIAYGNIGYADESQGWINTDAVDPDELPAACSNVAGANCGRLLWHHAGAYSQAKSP